MGTDMHWFTFLSTAAIVMMAFSHVIIFAIFHRGERKRAVIHRVKKLSKSRRTAPAVIRVQRLARVYLARKYLLFLLLLLFICREGCCHHRHQSRETPQTGGRDKSAGSRHGRGAGE